MKHALSFNIDTGDVVLYDDETNIISVKKAIKDKEKLEWTVAQ